MHLLTIIAFAFLFWRVDQPAEWVVIGPDRPGLVLLIALGQPVLILLLSALAARRTRRLMRRGGSAALQAQIFHHRVGAGLRLLIGVGFGATVFLTAWPDWFAYGEVRPALQVVGDLLTLTPFLASVVGMWLAAYRMEQQLRADAMGVAAEAVPAWRLWAYLDFQARHHLFIVAVPMLIILFAANLIRAYDTTLQELTGWVWAPDALLGCVALGVFAVAPLLLRRIWRTEPLPDGPLRERLEEMCARIRLRCRDILVWKSDGMMINAAVMGVFAPFRYVLLSDALLSNMSMSQIEAVFGHEAGHVRHKHMLHFLTFAAVGWLAISGLMEFLAATFTPNTGSVGGTAIVVQGVGLVGTIAFWGLGFGWLSRRFESQADLFAARSVTPMVESCRLPCSVHREIDSPRPSPPRVCATGADIFASALDRVAVLNGIPQDEHTWRHPSIASRIHFLTVAASDPAFVERFELRVGRVNVSLLVLALIGGIATAIYLLVVPEPFLLRLQVGRF